MSNVAKTVEEMRQYLVELHQEIKRERVWQIYRQACVCDDLMLYSSEVHSDDPAWIELADLVGQVLRTAWRRL